MQKNLTSERKNFGADTEEFRKRQVKALQKRLVHTATTAKEVARFIERDPETVLNWRNGRTIMSGADVSAVDRFFQRNGDFDFLTDLYGDASERRRQQAAALEKRARELRGGSTNDELDRMEILLTLLAERRAAAE